MENLKELKLLELNFDEKINLDGGWGMMGPYLMPYIEDFCSGFADGFSDGANEGYQNSPFTN
jgi:hypothetical protein